MLKLKSLKTLLAIVGLSSTFLITNPLLVKTVYSSPSGDYTQAREELPEDYYILYRIVDRIARANNLNNLSWRVKVEPQYDINAFATEVNLIAVYDGLLDQLSGKSSALACVIAHEIAHHVEKHIAMGQKEREVIRQQIIKEAEAQVIAEMQDAQKDNRRNSAIGAGFSVLGTALDRQFDSSSIRRSVQNENQKRIAQAQQRMQEIVEQKEKELEQRILENSRRQEFEADAYGYIYMATAGFDAKGCLETMEVLSRIPGTQFDTTHPSTPKRIQLLEKLMEEYPAEKLAQKGSNQLQINEKPLTYDLSKDGRSLRINPQSGSTVDDLERQLGN